MEHLPRSHCELARGLAAPATLRVVEVVAPARRAKEFNSYKLHTGRHGPILDAASVLEVQGARLASVDTLPSPTLHIRCTGDAVGYRGVETTGTGITRVIGANIGIFTDQRRARLAGATAADITVGTGIAVVTNLGIWRVHAAVNGVAGIGGAKLLIVTFNPRTTTTEAPRAELTDRTGIVVIAGHRVVHMDAPLCGIAGVISAKVIVVAIQRQSRRAHTVAARIIHSAGIGIIAGYVVVHKLAAGKRGTAIGGAEVGVFALKVATADTVPEVAVIAGGADVTVIARHAIEQVNAAHRRVTGIGGTEIVIVAIGGRASLANAGDTDVHQGAAIAIVAFGLSGYKLAT
jgi:hypothetical protein